MTFTVWKVSKDGVFSRPYFYTFHAVNYFYIKNSLVDVSLGSKYNPENTAQKMKFSIKDFFIKCETSRPEVFYKKDVLKNFTSNL